MSALVYQAINAVAAELASTGIAKSHRNEEGDYSYRSIEDVLAALSPLLATHRLCVLPRVQSREAVRLTRTSQLVTLQVAYDLISALDGSAHTIESIGEAIDEGDKGSAKAMSAAYKSAMLQAFAIPVTQEDSDRSSLRLNGHAPQAQPEPPEGWERWAEEVAHILASCETSEAIERLLTSRRATLTALQKSRSELYAKLGEAIAARLSTLQSGEAQTSGKKVPGEQAQLKVPPEPRPQSSPVEAPPKPRKARQPVMSALSLKSRPNGRRAGHHKSGASVQAGRRRASTSAERGIRKDAPPKQGGLQLEEVQSGDAQGSKAATAPAAHRSSNRPDNRAHADHQAPQDA